MRHSFTSFPGGLKLPMDTSISMRADVKWIRILLPWLRTKAKISSDVLGPKIASEAISQHPIQKIFLGGHAPTPPSFCIHANIHTWVEVSLSWTNAILLPPGLPMHFSIWIQYHIATNVICLGSAYWLKRVHQRLAKTTLQCVQYSVWRVLLYTQQHTQWAFVWKIVAWMTSFLYCT